MKIALIIDHGELQKFALDALDAIDGTDEISVFSCTNTHNSKKWLQNAGYYALNLLSVRNRLTRRVPITLSKKRVASTTSFASEYEGAWQRLPPHVIGALNEVGFDAVLKFGMGLLRVPRNLHVPILSYHHGDPEKYRGRPAGFWEMAGGAATMGQIVQVISNRLDAGKVVAYAETKVMPWSYRGTLVEAYRHSPLIINEAIQNVRSGRALKKPSNGRSFGLPSNMQVAVFAAKMMSRFIRRLLYGAFIEKAWRVSTAPVPKRLLPRLLSGMEFPAAANWTHVPVTEGYAFYADPFFVEAPPGILVEAARSRNGIGEIVFVGVDGQRRVSCVTDHMSYPSVSRVAGREIVIPETARWSPPLVCDFDGHVLKPKTTLRIEGHVHVLDPTLVERNGSIYLFGNIRQLGSSALYLWSAETLDGTFTLHTASPIRISPEGSRMGGGIIEHDCRLFRLGQDCSGAYGNGLIMFEITTLTPDAYSERQVGRIVFGDRKGPHTLNLRDGGAVFDWYTERVCFMAAVRRLASASARWKTSRA